jgi:uncharacterized repeat protein (TIGR01451 family)
MTNLRALILFALCMGCVIISKSVPFTEAQTVLEEQLPRAIENHITLAHTEPKLPSEQQIMPAAVDEEPVSSINLWSRVIFQSYRDGVWNIYSSKSHGTELQQLTNESAHNIHPDFNRGTSQLVFASQAANNYAIHRMNSDGSNRVVLANSPANDVYPRWSPDGTKVAFESYRDGQAEVYVMNGDGSQLQRLTFNPGFDGMPAWSPDGTKIAYISQRNGLYRVWVMNADGSNPVQLSQTPSSAFPAWSPDGTQIAYTADVNQDGWAELWVMNANGTNARQLLSPSGNQDLWARGWSPDSNYITYTRINFVSYYGLWFWTTASFGAVNPANNSTVFLSSHELDWHPHWQTTDAAKPIVELNSYPRHAPPQPVLSWSGTDIGASGFLSFDLQYRPSSSGLWQNWLMNTTATEAPLTAPLGDSYTFRIRGRDQAHNVSNWQVSSNPLTLYAWTVQGRMTDNAGAPIMGATIETIPAPFLGGNTDSNGQFALYVDQILGAYQTTWQKPGYGNLPVTVYPGTPTEAQARVVLPPVDNLVENGDFELGNLGVGWEAFGNYAPSITDGVFNTGQHAALLGRTALEANVSDWTTITGTTPGGSESHFVVGDDGRLHLIWQHGQQLHYVQRAANGTWSTPVTLTPEAGPIAGQQLAVASNGHVHVIWQQQINWSDNVYYRYLTDDSWSAPLNLTGFTTSPTWAFKTATTSDGRLHVVLPVFGAGGSASYALYYRERDPGGSWSTPSLLSATLVYDALLMKSQGNVIHLVSAIGSYTNQSYYWQKTAGSSWSVPQTIPAISTVNQFDIAVTLNGHVHLISWRSDGPLYYNRRSPTGQWSSAYRVTEQLVAPNSARIVAAVDNSLHLLWSVYANPAHSPQQRGLHHIRRLGNGQWTESKWFYTDGSAFPRMFVTDSNGNLHLLMNRSTHLGNTHHYLMASPEGLWAQPSLIVDDVMDYMTGAIGPDDVIHLLRSTWEHAHLTRPGGESTMRQSITIPAAMADPYLSFVYQMAGASYAVGTGLTVTVSTINETVLLAHIQENSTNWTQVSLPLTDWVGETITLTWAASQPGLAIPVAVWLDDVTVGSAHPDLWLAGVNRQTALPGETVSYQLFYGNRGGAAAASATITLQLPANLLFVSASPAPAVHGTTLTWELGDLAAFSTAETIDLTLSVASQAPVLTTLSTTAVIGTPDLELEMLNNQRPLILFVGREAYLPILTR